MRFDNARLGPLLFILETVSITIKYGNIQLFETTCAEIFAMLIWRQMKCRKDQWVSK